MAEEKKLTGFPSIDKPWLKYYPEEAICAPLPECMIYEYLWQCNREHLNDNALYYFGKSIDYKTLFSKITQAAKGFYTLGVRAGEIVTVFSTNTPGTVYCLYALNYIGAIANMEYVTESEKEAIEAVEACKSHIVVILDVLLPKFSKVVECETVKNVVTLPLAASMPFAKRLFVNLKSRRVLCEKELPFAELCKIGKETQLNQAEYCKDTPAFIVHSGGTTGKPKGVLISNDSLNFIAWQYTHIDAGYKRSETYMHFIPPFHAFGLGVGVHMPLSLGFELILSPTFDQKTILKLFVKKKPVHLMAGASHISAIISSEKVQKMSLNFQKTFAFGGSAISNDLEKNIGEFLVAHHSLSKPLIGYGMSEFASTICFETNKWYGKIGSVGIPFCKANVKVLDTDTGEELQYGKQGELCFSTPGLMLGYYKNEQETNAAIFTDCHGTRWMHTGDVGYVDEDGFVFITGRIKRIYSTRAERNGTIFKIFPDYIANLICEVNQVKDCAVVCIPDGDYSNIAIAFAVLASSEEEKVNAQQIEDYLKDKLPSHCIPKQIVLVDSLPLSPVGKVDYKALEKQADDLYSTRNSSAP